MFVRSWRDNVSSRSSEVMVWKEVSEPECVGVAFMVDNEEEEGSAEWHGVGGRDTGSPLGVRFSPSSDRSFDGPSHASSSEGKRGRLFGRVFTVNSASCQEIQVRRIETGKKKRLTTLSRCSATACHQCLISCLNSFLSVSSIMVLEVIAGGVFSTHPSLVK
jgi:hypothetical protein